MISDVLAVALACLALYGTVRLTQDCYRATRALGRSLGHAAEWLHTRWRARSADRERRTVQRREGVAALNAEALRDLTGVLVDMRAELARVRAETVTTQVPVAGEIITLATCGRGTKVRMS